MYKGEKWPWLSMAVFGHDEIYYNAENYRIKMCRFPSFGFARVSSHERWHIFPHLPCHVTSSVLLFFCAHMARVVAALVIHVSTEQRFLLARAGQAKKTVVLTHNYKTQNREREDTQPRFVSGFIWRQTRGDQLTPACPKVAVSRKTKRFWDEIAKMIFFLAVHRCIVEAKFCCFDCFQ